MQEKIEDYKAELVYPHEVTNELIFNGYLVGVYTEHEYNATVIVLKNKMNDVTGEIPLNLWDQLVGDFNDLKEKAQRIAEDEVEDEVVDEGFEVVEAVEGLEEILSSVFNSTGKSFDEIRLKVEKVQEEVVSKGNIIFSNFLKDFEKMTADMQPKVQEVADDIKETVKTEADKVAAKGLEKAHRVKLEIKKLKLQKLEDEAVDMDVSTKGFSKKIRNKIQNINNSLGE